MVHLNYGFDTERLRGRRREQRSAAAPEPFTFGFIGRIVPAKGLEVLLDGFAGAGVEELEGKHAQQAAGSGAAGGDGVRLRLWGPGDRSYVSGLKDRVENDRFACPASMSLLSLLNFARLPVHIAAADHSEHLIRSTSEFARRSRLKGRVEFLPDYDNKSVVETVFNRVDCIVVPSIWRALHWVAISHAGRATQSLLLSTRLLLLLACTV